jgi:excinuclease ABC subunit B
LQRLIRELEKEMKQAARDLEFEKAAMLRDQIYELRQQLDAADKRPEWEKLREAVREEARIQHPE